jgi:hypothetical protein
MEASHILSFPLEPRNGGFPFLIGFCCALRGEEIPLASLYGVAVHWAEAENHRLKHTFDEKEIKCGPLF